MGKLPEGDEWEMIVFDIDGTLLDMDGFQPELIPLIRKIEQMGITVSLASGRTLPNVTPIQQVLAVSGFVVGENGAEVLMQDGGNKDLSNEQLAAGLAGGGGSQAVVSAINNLSTKMDTLIQRLGAPGDFIFTVNKREFARLTNEHFGEAGSSPLRGVG